MTAMPQLVAAFHSLVGLAAVLVGAAAYLNPVAFGIADVVRGIVPGAGALTVIEPVSRVELGLGVAIGALTRTVSSRGSLLGGLPAGVGSQPSGRCGRC